MVNMVGRRCAICADLPFHLRFPKHYEWGKLVRGMLYVGWDNTVPLFSVLLSFLQCDPVWAVIVAEDNALKQK